MKKLILILIILFCSVISGQKFWWDEWGGNLYTSTSAEIYGLNNVPLKHYLGGKYTFSRAGADLEALFDKIDSLTLAMSSLNIFDDGLTTQILVGGGLNVVPVWGTNLSTAITIGSAYIYRAGGTDVADGDVADTITITNISQVQDITATATEINYTTDVTSNIQAQIDNKQDTVLGITSAEIAYLDGLTDTVQQQLDLKAPLTAPTFATSITGSYLTASEILITDGSKNIISAAVATYPSLTELSYVKGVTSAIQTQMNLKAPLASPTFTGTSTTDTISFGNFYIVEVNSNNWSFYSSVGDDADDLIMVIDSLGQVGYGVVPVGYKVDMSGGKLRVQDGSNTGTVRLSGTADPTGQYAEIVFSNAGQNSLTFTNKLTDNANLIKFVIGTTNILTMLGSGKVSIGNNSPDISLSNNGAYNYWADTSTVANLYGINTDDFGTALLTTGTSLFVNIATANTGTATLRINAGTTATIKKLHDQNLISGDIEAGHIIHLIFDGTNFQMLSQLAQ